MSQDDPKTHAIASIHALDAKIDQVKAEAERRVEQLKNVLQRAISAYNRGEFEESRKILAEVAE